MGAWQLEFPAGNYSSQALFEIQQARQNFAIECEKLENPELGVDSLTIDDVNNLILKHEQRLSTSPEKKPSLSPSRKRVS